MYVATPFLFLKKMVMTWHVHLYIYCGHPQPPESTYPWSNPPNALGTKVFLTLPSLRHICTILAHVTTPHKQFNMRIKFRLPNVTTSEGFHLWNSRMTHAILSIKYVNTLPEQPPAIPVKHKPVVRWLTFPSWIWLKFRRSLNRLSLKDPSTHLW